MCGGCFERERKKVFVWFLVVMVQVFRFCTEDSIEEKAGAGGG